MYFALFLIFLIHGSNASGFQYAFDIRMTPYHFNQPPQSAREFRIELCTNLAEFIHGVAMRLNNGRVAYEKYRADGTLWKVEIGEIMVPWYRRALMFLYPEQDCSYLHLPYTLDSEDYLPHKFADRFMKTCENFSDDIERLRIVIDMYRYIPRIEQEFMTNAFDDLDSLVMPFWVNYRDIIFEPKPFPDHVCSDLPNPSMSQSLF